MNVYKSFEELKSTPLNNPVLTIGTYDGVHFGHQQIIKRIIELSKEVNGESTILTFDPHPRIVLNPNYDLKLLCSVDEKIQLLSEYGIDNLIVAPFSKSFAAMDAKDYIRNILVKNFEPHTIVLGYDHHFGKGRKGDIHLLRELQSEFNYKLEEIPKQTIDDISVSSTKVRNALLNGDITTANQLLAHPYFLTGQVVHGNKIGRTLGFPTANIQINNPYKLIPPVGIYAVYVKIDNSVYKGALSIGYRPTVVTSGGLTIEVYILDFNQDIYDQDIELIFKGKIRDEQKFDSKEILIDQMKKDVKKVESILQ